MHCAAFLMVSHQWLTFRLKAEVPKFTPEGSITNL